MKYFNKEIILLQEKLDKIKITEPQMTFLQVVDRGTREVVISKYLAFLLDERNTTFKIIEKILTNTCGSIENHNINFEERQLEGVFTEYQLSKENRLDIFIKYSNFWIVIENKIFSGESRANQTLSYKTTFDKVNENNLPIFFLYLKLGANPSKPSENDFKILTYEKLYSILNTIKEIDLCKSENYKFLLDFKIHIKERLMKGLKIDTEEMKFYLENQDKLNSILRAYNENCQLVKKELVDAFKDRFKDEFQVKSTNTYIQVYRNNWDNGMVHFELLFKRGDNFENIISKTDKTFFFCLHKEGKSRNKYSETIENKSKEEKFSFSCYENITKSIQNIVDKFDKMLVKEYTKTIDSVFNKKV